MSQPSVRAVAFYLPQFHPIPENDEWWGPGFTEWRNVANARPLFPGHYQPHLPADLGFYDLRLPETREAQAELAVQYGIEGFCYWHYWFNGKRLLERPFDEVLSSGEPNLPFCLAWANEHWSRRWLGDAKAVLMEQTYSDEDDLAHARWLTKVFSDSRCLRVSGRPVFLIYRAGHLPNARKTTDVIRSAAVKAGLPNPYLLSIGPNRNFQDFGFDGTVKFEPQLGDLPLALDDSRSLSRLKQNLRFGIMSKELKLYDYAEARRRMNGSGRSYFSFPTVLVGWDNTPRRGRKGVVLLNGTPERFGGALAQAVQSVVALARDERLVFINAWNEWAEGNHLEPDAKYGLSFLEQVKAVLG